MEHAPLRPVPSRPPSPVDPAEAIRHVTAELSALDAPAVEALALVALAGRSREEVAGHDAGLSGEPLAEALARARKALRRRLHPLPGSGWCERAERLISDRIDGVLVDPGPARLEVHLANCSRCVEHERRLAQAQDALVAGFVESIAPPPEAEPRRDAEAEAEAQVEPETDGESAPAPAAALRIVDDPQVSGPAPAAPEGDAPIRLPPAEEAPALPEPDEPPALPEAEEPEALAEAEEPAALTEAEEPAALAEAAEPAVLPETEEPSPTLGEAEPPEAAGEVVPMPVRPPATPPAPPVLRPVPDREERPAAPPMHVPLRAVPDAPPPPSPSPPPAPARSALAASYARPAPAESAGSLAGDAALSAVGPLLAIATLAIVLLALTLILVGL